ncbi:MAG: hypothetical protein ABSG32_03640 [Terriglobia bacterium]|jgi:hypothetical protein
MKFGRITAVLWVIGVLAGAPPSTRAEEIILKNGQKIVGTIVGYDNDMFRVETEFGIALVRKDKVASIQVSKPGVANSNPQEPKRPATKTIDVKPARVEAAPEGVPDSTPPPTPTRPPALAKPSAPPPAPISHSVEVPVQAKSPAPPPYASHYIVVTVPTEPPPPPVIHLPDSMHLSKGTLSAVLGRAPTLTDLPPPPPPPSHPVDVPMPAHLEEHVDGNNYFSDTFQFSMFKPPDWKIFEGVPKETGSGIMAMGTEDERTLLIVDRQVWSGAPNLTSDQMEARLRQTYREYHRISEDAFQYDGQTATRRTFTGVLEGAEWHGVAVHVIHGNTVFGIIGLTSAETFQFQEAIFKKIIKTFHFLTPTTPTAAIPITIRTP